jgi:hypothetical protein
MAINQTVESPNFEKINEEAGQFTSDAISLLWLALNDTRAVERRDHRQATEVMAPKVLPLAPTVNQDNLDIEGASVLSFTGASSVNITGFRAPDTGKTRLLLCQVNGAGTITFINSATSESSNQIVTSTGENLTRATNTGICFLYLGDKWREVART